MVEVPPRSDGMPLVPMQPVSNRSSSSMWSTGPSSSPSKAGTSWYTARSVGKALVIACLLINALVMIRLSLLPSTMGEGLLGMKQAAAAADDRRLAVVVPAHSGDLRRALASLARWPKACSRVTLQHVELVLYYAGTEDDSGWSDNVMPELEQTGGRCFARTSVVFGNLTDEVREQRKSDYTPQHHLFTQHLDQAHGLV